MATIGKIRQRSGLVILLIGVAIVLFLISDAISNNSNLFRDVQTSVGEIAGEEISAQEFDQRFKQFQTNYKNNQGVRTLDAEQRMDVNNQTWESFIQDRTLGAEYEELGIAVSEDELWDIVQGENPDPNIQRIFVDQNGNFDRNRLISFLQNFDQVPPDQQASWIQFEKGLRDSRQRLKFNNLVSKGTYVTQLEAEEDYLNKNLYASIKYVSLPATSIPDSTITVTDAEIREEAKRQDLTYPNDLRTVQYVSFSAEPTAQDTAAVKKEIAKLKTELAAQQNPVSFARIRTEGTASEDRFLSHSEVPAYLSDALDSAEAGDVFGPIYQFGGYTITRIVAIGEDSVNSYRAAHILLRVQGSDTAAVMKKAEGIVKELEEGAEFRVLAARESKDPGSAARGGDLGWWRKGGINGVGGMIPNFQAAVDKMEVGEVKIQKTREGIHIIKLTHEPTRKTYKIAEIQKLITASPATIDLAYDRAASFYDKAKTAQAFADAIIEENLDVRIAEDLKPMDVSIPGIDDARSLISWAYQQESVDAVSDIISFDEEYVIALLTEIKVEGDLNIADNETTLRDDVAKRKKVEQLYAKMQEQDLSDLETLAGALETEVKSASNINFNTPLIPNLGEEPKVLGHIFSLEKGQLSGIIKGDEGVYVVQIDGYSEVDKPDSYFDYKKSIESSSAASSQFYVLNALRELANVEDKRYLFY